MYAVGNTVTFGEYEQDNDKANGWEAIQWQVLKHVGNEALLISENNLECLPYNNSDECATWEACTLRAWLNSSFLNMAFTVDEQQAILTTSVRNNTNSDYSTYEGTDTYDLVFLLSIEEAETLFQGDRNRQARNTPYTEARGASTNYNYSIGSWWLRSLGEYGQTAIVGEFGNIVKTGVSGSIGVYAVRPAFWLDLSSDVVTSVSP